MIEATANPPLASKTSATNQHSLAQTKPHLGIVSVVFDRKAEGICTGRLTRALLQHQYPVTAFSSKKAKTDLQHPQLVSHFLPFKPRQPRWLLNTLTKLSGGMANNFSVWTQRLLKLPLSEQQLPDIFYGRAWPHSSLVAAYQLSKKYHRPLMIHFSDPLPPADRKPPKAGFIKDLQKIVDHASAITFVNKAIWRLQQQATPFDDQKAWLLPHVTSAQQVFDQPPETGRIAYIGTARSHSKQVDNLVAGFARFQAQTGHKNSQLVFVGSDRDYIQKLAKPLASTPISVLDYQVDVTPEMAKAEILVLVNPTAEMSATKLLEYCNCNRKVLLVAKAGSPDDQLARQFPETTSVVNDYLPEKIAEALTELSQRQTEDSDFERRFLKMNAHSPEAVVQQFAKIYQSFTITSVNAQ